VITLSLQQATLTLLLKRSRLSKENINNHRPMFNVLFLSKHMDEIVARRIEELLNCNDFHESCQSTYCEVHLTETALFEMMQSGIA